MSLHNFCSWQKTLNEQGHAHHDVAVLVTRTSICETSENNCGILGELIVSYSILPEVELLTIMEVALAPKPRPSQNLGLWGLGGGNV